MTVLEVSIVISYTPSSASAVSYDAILSNFKLHHGSFAYTQINVFTGKRWTTSISALLTNIHTGLLYLLDV
jgi:hypothetical protein